MNKMNRASKTRACHPRYHLRFQILPGKNAARDAAALAEFCRAHDIEEAVLFFAAEEWNNGLLSRAEEDLWFRTLREAKGALDRSGITVSLNPWMTVLHCARGRGFPKDRRFQAMVSPLGEMVEGCASFACPNWRKYIRDLYGCFAKLGFRVIWVEDFPFTHWNKSDRMTWTQMALAMFFGSDALFGKLVWALDDAEIERYLRGGVFLDGTAADILCRRGFGRHVGFDRVRLVGREHATYSVEKVVATATGVPKGFYLNHNLQPLENDSRGFVVISNGSVDPAKPVVKLPGRSLSNVRVTLLSPLQKPVSIKTRSDRGAVRCDAEIPYLGYLVIEGDTLHETNATHSQMVF